MNRRQFLTLVGLWRLGVFNMTQSSQPWGGTSLGDAIVAPYSDQEWTEMYRWLFGASKSDEGPLLGSGVSPDPGLLVSPTGPASAGVSVSRGSAIVNGTYYSSDAAETLSIAANASGNPRIDTIILRKDVALQTVRLAVLQGTPAATPVAPSLTQTTGIMWEIPLADIAVANGFSTIVAANIQPRMHFSGMSDGVYLQDILNNSGGILQTGDTVIWDSTADRAVTVSTVAGDPLAAGVWVGRTAAGGYGRVLTEGIGWIRTTGAIAARGTALAQSTTARQAVGSTSGTTIATSLQITAGAGLCLAFIKVAPASTPLTVTQVHTGLLADKTIAANQLTFIDVDATNIKITHVASSTRTRVTIMGYVNFVGAVGGVGVALSIYNFTSSILAGNATWGLVSFGAFSAEQCSPFTVDHVFTGLTVGVSYEFRLRWRVWNAGGGAAMYAPALSLIAQSV